jgi:hypothetical protein
LGAAGEGGVGAGSMGIYVICLTGTKAECNDNGVCVYGEGVWDMSDSVRSALVLDGEG